MSSAVAICIGNFDGVHVGHVRLIEAARAAVGTGGVVHVLAFEPHPVTVLRPQCAPARLTHFADRVPLLRAAGADQVTPLVPTPALLEREPAAFIDDLVERYHPAYIVEGPDFRFGRDRAGSIDTLRALESGRGYETIVVDPVERALACQQVATASSTMIRWLVARGRVGDAACLLGRPYVLTGPVVRGDQRGRTIGVPTANLDHGDLLLPADGIYAGRAARVEAPGDAGGDGGDGDPAWRAAAISVGTKPTFGERPRTCEVHIVGFDGPLDDYGWALRVEVRAWLRDQVCYPDVPSLVNQLRRDVDRARAAEAGAPGAGAAGMTTVETYASNTTWSEVARRVRAADRIAVVTHERPDGDALGCALALARALPALGKQVEVLLAGPLEPFLETLIGATPVARVEDGDPGDDHDLVIVVDTGAWTQLGPLADWVRERRERTVVIDHHPHGDDMGGLRMVDTGAAAAAEMVLALLDALGFGLGSPAESPAAANTDAAPGARGVAEALFVGVATDSGWFRYGNTTPGTLRVAARLLEAGVDQPAAYELVEQNYRREHLALAARALASVEFVAGGVVAIQALQRSDFEETGGTVSDLSGVVNAPMCVAGVRVAILLAETVPGTTKISLRAKAAPDGDDRLGFLCDVGRIARSLGGGGHRAAAGVRVETGLEEARRALLEAMGVHAGA